MDLHGVLEGILFVVGDEGITLKAMSEILKVDVEVVKQLLKELREKYDKPDSGIRISFLGDTFKLTTKSEHRDYFQSLIENPNSNGLSQAALETLAIVAYNQPITRLQIDELRGVSTGQMVRKLVAKGFLKESGKATVPGRPNLYKTTSFFLDYFGLATINDLPELKENLLNKDIQDETELFTSIYKEN